MQYFVIGGNGERYGPATVDELNQWAVEGRVNAYSMVVPEGLTDAMPIASVAGFKNDTFSRPPEQPNYQQPSPYMRPIGSVNNHLVKSILATLFCCLPIGIVAIVFAAQVDGYVRSGNMALAEETSKKASTWANVSIGLSLAGYLVYGVFIVIMIATGNMK